MSARGRLRVLAVVFAVATVLALATACAPSPSDSGVTGTVRIGPIAPVQRPGEPGEAPYAAELVVMNASGATVARTKSGADGAYRVNLAPGSYTIGGASGPTPPTPPTPVAFTVAAHRFTTVDLSFDSGIR